MDFAILGSDYSDHGFNHVSWRNVRVEIGYTTGARRMKLKIERVVYWDQRFL